MNPNADNVLVVGAGPVGLTVALQLLAAGQPVTVLEREHGLPEDMRASTFHPATLDLLAPSGLAAALVAQGTRVPRWQYRVHETGEAAVFDLGLLAEETRHPYRLQCEQFRFARLVMDHLRDHPGFTLLRGACVTGLEQDAESVHVDYTHLGEAQRMGARWVVAADGGRSSLRKLMDLSFEGSVFPKTSITLVLDHAFEEQDPDLLGVNYVWSDQGHYSLMRVRDCWRFSYSPEPEETVEEALSEPRAQERLRRVFPSEDPYRILQRNHYTLHQRCLENFVQGRVLFAGDAAHLNSPAGGMGMNSGIHDAFCLVEHLLPVLAGEDARMLARYDRRRRTIATEEVQRLSARNYRRHRETDPARRRQVFEDLQATANEPEQARAFLRDSAMLNALRREREIP